MKFTPPILKKLGSVPFWRGEKRFIAELERMYTKAKDSAARTIAKDQA